ncbi:hypothetical protein TI39_contig63g00001 [Zymoseptoria brevis]|uniref:BTB domain-containing protein n=1 Tax=Zymoseptoria brevis TaxID=1047168 RepID=A0A0F4GY13_9PEZI|nr:hypothetical protein TI39_contig63g00001 [Zymoseptoria brevis]
MSAMAQAEESSSDSGASSIDTNDSTQAHQAGLEVALATSLRPIPQGEHLDGAEDDADCYLRETCFDRHLCFYKFFVGPDCVPFVVHIDRLQRHCPGYLRFLEKMKRPMKGKAPAHQGIQVHDVLASTYRLFVTYLYSGEIVPVPAEDRARTGEPLDMSRQSRAVPGNPRQNDVADIDLVRLHQFALTHGCHSLATDSISLLLAQNAHWNGSPTDAAIDYVHQNFDANSTIFELLGQNALVAARDAMITTGQPVETRLEKCQRQVREYMHPGQDTGKGCKCWRKSFSVGEQQDHGPHLYTNIAILLVGPEELPFVVHKDVIGKHSAYFRRAFTNGFLETHTGIVKLPSECAGVLAIYLEWLYNGEIDLPWEGQMEKLHEYYLAVKEDLEDLEAAAGHQKEKQRSASLPMATDVDTVTARQAMASIATAAREIKLATEEQTSAALPNPAENLLASSSQDSSEVDGSGSSSISGNNPPQPFVHRLFLTSLYAFASRRLIPALGNQIMDLLISTRYSERRTSLYSADLEMVEQAYKTLPRTSKLCKFLVDEAAWCWEPQDSCVRDNDLLRGFPRDFVEDVMREGLRLKKEEVDEASFWVDLCATYHEHESEEEQMKLDHPARFALGQLRGRVQIGLSIEPWIRPCLCAYEHRLLLVSLFNFACRRLIPALGNQVMNFLVSTRYSEGLTSLYSTDPAMVKLAFALPEKSRLRKFLAEEAVWCWTASDNLIKDDDRDHLDDFPKGFHQVMTRATLMRTANA